MHANSLFCPIYVHQLQWLTYTVDQNNVKWVMGQPNGLIFAWALEHHHWAVSFRLKSDND